MEKRNWNALGKDVSVDSKPVRTFPCGSSDARGRKKPEKSANPEASRGYKSAGTIVVDGETIPLQRSWFGYKVHVLCDANHEVPLGWKVTTATRPDNTVMEALLDEAESNVGGMKVKSLGGDKGYDPPITTKRIRKTPQRNRTDKYFKGRGLRILHTP